MDRPTSRARLHGPAQACLLIIALLITGSVAAACTGDHASTPSQTASSAMSSMNDTQAAAWAVRPAYTHVSARTEEAYSYAMEHQAVLQWIPCFCGCGAMGHGNNADCYFEPSANGSIVFEEHASYCGVCVDITLRTKQLAASGASLSSIRTTIDAEFGGVGPGTDTERPAS